MNASVLASPYTATTAHTHGSAELIDLARIFERSVQLAVWERPPQTAISAYLDLHRGELGMGIRTTLTAGTLPDLSSLPAAPGRDRLSEDIARLSELVLELLGCESVGLRLEVIRQAMCPRLHVDRVGIRLLCTYRGPGTEWIDDRGVDRSKLGRGAGGLADEVSGLFGTDTCIRRIEPFHVALLKGNRWQENGERGVLHRSPEVPPAVFPRVLLALDPLW